jgi:DNA methylase
MKPVGLIERALINSSKSGDMVVDLFGGSGSTLIACERRNRKARLMEIDPGYADVIVRRWQNYVGKQATLEDGGRTYHEVAQERLGIIRIAAEDREDIESDLKAHVVLSTRGVGDGRNQNSEKLSGWEA